MQVNRGNTLRRKSKDPSGEFGIGYRSYTRAAFALACFALFWISLIGPTSSQLSASHSNFNQLLSFGQSASPPWQQFQHDAQHTGQSQSSGPDSNSADWVFGPVGSIMDSPVIGSDGTIYFTSSNMYVYALSPDGSLKWKYFLGEMPYQPALDSNGRLLVPTTSHIYIFSSDGTLAETPIEVRDPNSTLTPAPNGAIYADFGNGTTELLSASGSPIWSAKTSCVGSSIAIGAAASASDVFCVSSKSANHLTAIGNTGAVLWVVPTKSGSSTVSLTPAVSPFTGDIYFDSPDGHLYGVTPAGSLIFSAVGSNVTSMPVIGSNGNVYVGGLAFLYEFSPSGSEIWQTPVGSPVLGLGVDSSENVYAIEKSSGLVSFTSYGAERWRYGPSQPGEESLSSFAMGSNGTVYFGSSCAACIGQWGNLYAVGRPAGEYPVTFAQSGLSAGTNWTLLIDGKPYFTSWRSETVSLPGGTHSWSAQTITEVSFGVRYQSVPQNGSVTVFGPTAVTLNYSKQYQVVWTVAPSNAGTVNPASGWFDPGSKVSMLATNAPGYEFYSWSSNSNELLVSSHQSNSTNVLVNGTGTLTAEFYVGLEIKAGSGGSVIYSSPPISGQVQPGTEQMIYVQPNSVVSLTPRPEQGYALASWSGIPPDTQPPLGGTVTLQIPTPTNVSASFVASNQSTLSTSTENPTFSSSSSTGSAVVSISASLPTTSASSSAMTNRLNGIDLSLIALIIIVIVAISAIAVLRRR